LPDSFSILEAFGSLTGIPENSLKTEDTIKNIKSKKTKSGNEANGMPA
jgi:hypothetical protein